MAKRVNTMSPWMLFGFFLCVIGTGILGFLYYEQGKTVGELKNAFKKEKAKTDRLTEEITTVQRKLKDDTQYAYGLINKDGYSNVQPKEYALKLARRFPHRVNQNASEEEMIKQILELDLDISDIPNDTKKTKAMLEELATAGGKMKQAILEREKTISTLKTTHTAKVNELESKIADQQNEFDNMTATKNAEISKLGEEKSALSKQVEDERAKLKVTTGEFEEFKQSHTKTIQNYKTEVFKLSEQLRQKNEIEHSKIELEKDGSIINDDATLRTNTVIIDLGKRDRVKRGMKFIVYRMDNGGVQKVKGQIEIRRVDENTSLCGIVEVEDKSDPIVKGDLLANQVYRKDGKYRFFLIGTFDNYSRAELKRLIEKEGSTVVEEGKNLHPSSVDFVIVGNIDKSDKGKQGELYNKAVRLSLNMMAESEIRKFLRDYSE